MIAQAAAGAALLDTDWLESVRARNSAARDLLCSGLTAIGVDFLPSHANFVCVRTGGGSGEIARRLAAEHQILVRDLEPCG